MSEEESQPPDIRNRPSDPGANASSASDTELPLVLTGFWDQSGRLYLDRERNHYVQFQPEAARRFGAVAPEHAPFLGEQATWVELEPGAEVEYVRTRSGPPADDFTVEVRLRGRAGRMRDPGLQQASGFLCISPTTGKPHEVDPASGLLC